MAGPLNQGVLDAFNDVAPVLRRCENNGWLAVAPEESPVHIGVFAWSADEARNSFLRARREWILLLEDVLRAPTTTPETSE